MIRRGIIDFTAFLNKEREVIIKELSVIDIESMCTQHWIFQPPQDGQQLMVSDWTSRTFENHNTWMSTYYHGLYYNNGTDVYETMPSALNYICHDIQVLFTHTTEKAKVLEKIFNYERAVFSLEQLGFPPLPRNSLFDISSSGHGEDECGKKKNKSCLFHEVYAPGFYCTTSAVKTMADWCNKNPDNIDMTKSENRIKTFSNWELELPTPKQLADQGFILLTQSKDSTKCVYCGIVLHKWEAEDDPAVDHEVHSPFCRFVYYQIQCRREEEKQKKKEKQPKPTNDNCSSDAADDDRGEDVCGCFESPKITKNELTKLCYA